MGTMARTGAPPDLSTASLEDRVSSRLSLRKAAPRPSSSPAASPSRASWTGFGELGDAGATGRSDELDRTGGGGPVYLKLRDLSLQYGLLVD